MSLFKLFIINHVTCSVWYCVSWHSPHIKQIEWSEWWGGRRGRDRMVVGFITTYAMVPITTNIVGLNPAQGEVYNIMW